jgi:hypothetical protein
MMLTQWCIYDTVTMSVSTAFRTVFLTCGGNVEEAYTVQQNLESEGMLPSPSSECLKGTRLWTALVYPVHFFDVYRDRAQQEEARGQVGKAWKGRGGGG